MKNKFIILIFAAAVILIALAGYHNYSNKKISSVGSAAPNKEAIILFYGDGCSHCAIVEKFIKENKIEEKIKFESREVFNNKENASLLGEKAVVCGLPTVDIGVPFLWDGANCIVGDEKIIEFFNEKIK